VIDVLMTTSPGTSVGLWVNIITYVSCIISLFTMKHLIIY